LQLAAPGHEVFIVGLDRLPADTDHVALGQSLWASDVVFVQRGILDSHKAFQAPGDQANDARVFVFPAIGFTGFHPDCVYLRDGAGGMIHGAAGPYHSALVAACFLEGLTLERAMRLHNSLVYAHLGYFDRYASDYTHLKKHFRFVGFSLDGTIRNGPPVFMHTVNHPRIEMLFGLARQAARLVGLNPKAATPPDDELAGGYVWPVYPEIATRIGVVGSRTFSAHGNPIELEEVCRRSFELFARGGVGEPLPPAVLRAREFIRREVIGLTALPPPTADAPPSSHAP
jgi:hypothetical protein